MTERKTYSPEAKRFNVSLESAEMMDSVRNTYFQLQNEYPYLAGVGFFGSRTQGREAEGSDLDTCIFVDSNKMDFSRSYSDNAKDIKERFVEDSGVLLGDHVGDVMNISLESTDMDIYDYFRLAESVRFQPQKERTEIIARSHEAENLFSRFFLSVGEGVYRNRKYILDQFDGYAKEKEYFKLLMQALAHFEQYRLQDQDMNVLDNYPMTIEEAKKHFLTIPKI